MTSVREDQMRAFLSRSGWGDADREFLAGDASNRRYDRLEHPTLGRAVLMDAPPAKGEDTRPFINIATHLRSIDLGAPEIIAGDTEHGFLILEDLGDDLFARVLARDLSLETQLYLAATDVLIVAQRMAPPAGLKPYGVAEMAETAMLAVDWYLEYTSPKSPDILEDFHHRIATLLDQNISGPPVFVQRDYHAENLLWLPEKDGIAKVGLLDFQDAMLGPPAYDLASLLKDARRDVSPNVQAKCIQHFIDQTSADPAAFSAAYAICSAQRNLRIIGVFARLSVRDGKRQYPDMLPRVWRNLMDDLSHPVLHEFGKWIAQYFPAPSPEIISTLKSSDV